jgi:hypothetical protein
MGTIFGFVVFTLERCRMAVLALALIVLVKTGWIMLAQSMFGT